MKLLIKRLKENAVLPRRATEESAGYDLSACIDAPLTVKAGETAMIPTGLSAQLCGEENAFCLYTQDRRWRLSSDLPLQIVSEL